MKLVAICDSPMLESGFGRVSKNLLSRWHKEGIDIEVLAVYRDGHPPPECNLYPFKIEPTILDTYFNEKALAKINHHLADIDEDFILWINSDIRCLKPLGTLIQHQKQNFGSRKMTVIGYLPIETEKLGGEEIELLQNFNKIVAYTEFGKKQLSATNKEIFVLPHGHQEDFHKTPNFRQYLFPQCGDELIIGNINSNSERKAIWQSILLHEELEKIGVSNYLYLHMRSAKPFNIIQFAQLYCSKPEKVFFPTEEFIQTQCNSSMLNNIYNSIDLYLSTSLGEGWGLTAMEAASCEKPLAIPKHTAFDETYEENECIFMPCENKTYYTFDNRVAPIINIKESAKKIANELPNFKKLGKAASKKVLSKKYSWDYIAKQWLDVFK